MNSWKLHVKLCSVGGILAFLSCGGQKMKSLIEFTSLASVYIAISMSLLRESLWFQAFSGLVCPNIDVVDITDDIRIFPK